MVADAFKGANNGYIGIDPSQLVNYSTGNQEYDNWTDLETPLNDVDKVSRVLESSYNFEVTKLENSSYLQKSIYYQWIQYSGRIVLE